MLMLGDVWMVLYSPHGTHINIFVPKRCVFMSTLFVCDFRGSEMPSAYVLICGKNWVRLRIVRILPRLCEINSDSPYVWYVVS
jgi:hypothetical protein